jgi:hypothetical protein
MKWTDDESLVILTRNHCYYQWKMDKMAVLEYFYDGGVTSERVFS